MLSDIVLEFSSIVADGIVRLRPYLNHFIYILIGLSLVLLAYKIAIGQLTGVGGIAWKALTVVLLYYLIVNFDVLAWLFEDLIVHLAVKVGGMGGSPEQFENPDLIIEFAVDNILEPIGDLVKKLNEGQKGLRGFKWEDLDIYITFGLLWLVTVLCFVTITVQLTLAIVEFHLLVLMSLILVPFLIFEPTRFIGTKPFGAVVGSAVKTGMLVLVTGVVFSIIRKVIAIPKTVDDVTIKWMVQVIVLCLSSTFILIKIPGPVASLLSGVPSLSAGGVFRTLSALVAEVAASLTKIKGSDTPPSRLAKTITGAPGGVGSPSEDSAARKESFRKAHEVAGLSSGSRHLRGPLRGAPKPHQQEAPRARRQ